MNSVNSSLNGEKSAIKKRKTSEDLKDITDAVSVNGESQQQHEHLEALELSEIQKTPFLSIQDDLGVTGVGVSNTNDNSQNENSQNDNSQNDLDDQVMQLRKLAESCQNWENLYTGNLPSNLQIKSEISPLTPVTHLW